KLGRQGSAALCLLAWLALLGCIVSICGRHYGKVASQIAVGGIYEYEFESAPPPMIEGVVITMRCPNINPKPAVKNGFVLFLSEYLFATRPDGSFCAWPKVSDARTPVIALDFPRYLASKPNPDFILKFIGRCLAHILDPNSGADRPSNHESVNTGS